MAALRLYLSRTEKLRRKRLEKLEDQAAVQAFLETNPKLSTSRRGMPMLLLYWLAIGDTLRSAHELQDAPGA